jgi:FemAB-related protein (PEP-CTERM system-associated)
VLDTLLERKGVLSRQIGEAKRAGQPIDGLLAEMKDVSAKIKSAKANASAKQLKEEGKEKVVGEVTEGSGVAPSQSLVSPLAPKLFGSAYTLDESIKVTIKRLDDDQFSIKWDQYVAHKDNASIYHFWEFKRIVQSSFGHKAVYLAAFDSEEKISGVLPAIEMNSRLFGHFIVSLPFFTYGAALADNEHIEHKLYTALIDYAKQENVQHVELRAMHAQEKLKASAPSKENKVSMVRSLPETSEQLWGDIGTKVRAQIKKAQRYALETKFGKAELINDFYTVFSTNMRDLGTPVYSKRFFSELMKSRLHKQFDIGVVYFKGEPVACSFLMTHNGMMEIPWASTLQSANGMNVNMFMYWDVLKKAIQRECSFFDFGRSSKDAGTYRFKKQWGAQPQQLYWYYWLPEGEVMPELNPNNPKYKLLINVWQKLPVWLSQLIGPFVVKYLP